MTWRILGVLATVIAAFIVLSTSILQSTNINIVYSQSPAKTDEEIDEVTIDYVLIYPGKVLPDSPLWFLKVLRDKMWFFVTINSERKAELKLMFADKRLSSARMLFEKEKYDLGVETLVKAERYLGEVVEIEKKNRVDGIDTTSFQMTLANAALKHHQVMDEILALSVEDLKPEIIKEQGAADSIFEYARNTLLDSGIEPPANPFSE